MIIRLKDKRQEATTELEATGQEDPDPLIDIKVWKVLDEIQISSAFSRTS